jgi:hypothetical protein
MKLDRAKLSRWAGAAFWLAAVFAFVMAVLPHPPRIPGEPQDKIQHIAAFAVLTGLGSVAWPSRVPIKLFLSLSAFGGLIEIVQAIPSLHRSSDWADWLADNLAIAVTLIAAAVIGRLSRRGDPAE